MRIIAGKHKKRIILMVGKPTTRETSDRIRESVFNMLGGQLEGTAVDLFSGSGAYALEAISRGLSHVTCVDHDYDAYQTIKENAKRIGELDNVTAIFTDYKAYLKSLSMDVTFDYIFIDPPYEMHIYDDLLDQLEHHLNSNGIIIIESEKKVILKDRTQHLKKTKEKTYGFKKITMYEKGA
ncbi:MAG: 16S rRNA (guanine(966)-N(2))-methyltransferase RsmD [Acholeplasmataceae bacterium]